MLIKCNIVNVQDIECCKYLKNMSRQLGTTKIKHIRLNYDATLAMFGYYGNRKELILV